MIKIQCKDYGLFRTLITLNCFALLYGRGDSRQRGGGRLLIGLRDLGVAHGPIHLSPRLQNLSHDLCNITRRWVKILTARGYSNRSRELRWIHLDFDTRGHVVISTQFSTVFRKASRLDAVEWNSGIIQCSRTERFPMPLAKGFCIIQNISSMSQAYSYLTR